MLSHKTIPIKHAIVVRPDDLQYLHNALSTDFSAIKYSARCVDGTHLDPENIGDLLHYENPRFQRIVYLNITASSAERSSSVAISIGVDNTIEKLTGKITLQNASLERQRSLSDDLVKRMNEMRPWYSPLGYYSFDTVLLVALLGIWLVANGYSLFQKFLGQKPIEPSGLTFTEGEAFVFGLLVMGALILLGKVLNRLRDYLFPRIFFVIGKQERVFKQRETIAYGIIGSILLGLLGDIIYSFIS